MIEHVHDYVLPAAFDVLPAAWRTPEASAMLLAIGLQESRFVYRRQIAGPARGFWQFELGGVKGILEHEATMRPLAEAVEALRFGVGVKAPELLELLATNDTVAAVCARCLLYTLPAALPTSDQPMAGWTAYAGGWRPGRPRLETWVANYAEAWRIVTT